MLNLVVRKLNSRFLNVRHILDFYKIMNFVNLVKKYINGQI